MKSNILSFLLGIALIVFTSSALVTSGIVTFKPAAPKSTVVYNGDEPCEFVRTFSARGYVVTNTTMSTTDRGYKTCTFVVMVKY